MTSAAEDLLTVGGAVIAGATGLAVYGRFGTPMSSRDASLAFLRGGPKRSVVTITASTRMWSFRVRALAFACGTSNPARS